MALISSRTVGRIGTLIATMLLVLASAVNAATTVATTYLHTDAAGSPVAATNESGAVIWREGYRPYGDRTKNQGPAAGNRQFFHGKAFDSDTGLSYFGARYYDPIVGRFMGIDAAGFDEDNLHSFNRYAYGNNNPYKYRDPDGNLPILIPVVMLIGAYMTGHEIGTVGYNVATGQQSLGSAVADAAPGLAVGVALGGGGKLLVHFSRSEKFAKEVIVSKSRHPESAAHIDDAISAGKPSTLTIDRAGSTARRREALKDTQRTAGKDRDEYPPAMFKEGGRGSSVRPVSPSDNRGAGACIGAQCRDLPDGARVRIRTGE